MQVSVDRYWMTQLKDTSVSKLSVIQFPNSVSHPTTTKKKIYLFLMETSSSDIQAATIYKQPIQRLLPGKTDSGGIISGIFYRGTHVRSNLRCGELEVWRIGGAPYAIPSQQRALFSKKWKIKQEACDVLDCIFVFKWCLLVWDCKVCFPFSSCTDGLMCAHFMM